MLYYHMGVGLLEIRIQEEKVLRYNRMVSSRTPPMVRGADGGVYIEWFSLTAILAGVLGLVALG